tara:strand:+ start:2108 stop:3931 length:1824 start_codon:yes stop_codon:yes gene_type:complete
MPNYQSTRAVSKQKVNVNYLSKDFDSIKRDLIDYLQRYFPDDYQDFNEASGGMAIIELLAYVGDMMSFYIDRQVNEGFLDRAIERKNIFSLAQNLGYQPKFARPAVVSLSISATFNDATSAGSTFILKKGSKVVTDFEPAVQFETLVDADFSNSANRVTTKLTDGTTQYSITSISAAAGSTRTFSYRAGAQAIPFLKITMPDNNITEFVSVTASDGKEYHQVDHLAQGSIFTGYNNATSTSADVEYILQYKKIPYRFSTEVANNGKTSLVFGGGTSDLEDSEIIPNPEDFVMPALMRGSPSGFSPAVVDSANFLKTQGLGFAPRDVNLDVKYRYGGGVDTNAGPRTLNRFVSRIIQFATPDYANNNAQITTDILSSLLVSNVEQASGGADAETSVSIRQNALQYFNSQNRAVTLQDYQVRVLSMPSDYGSVFRSYARKDPNNSLGVELITLARNASGYLTAPAGALKNNVETYLRQFKSFADTVRITNGKTANIGIDFTILPESDSNLNDALLDCFILLKGLFVIENTNFNATIVTSEYVSRLQALNKVRSVVDFKFTSKYLVDDSRVYSPYQFDIQANTQSGVVSFPQDVCWELKYPNFDIVGRGA